MLLEAYYNELFERNWGEVCPRIAARLPARPSSLLLLFVRGCRTWR
jgi:hypothetical protein